MEKDNVVEVFRRNEGGQWKFFTLSKEELSALKKEVVESNVSLFKKLKEKFPELTELERIEVFRTVCKFLLDAKLQYIDRRILEGSKE